MPKGKVRLKDGTFVLLDMVWFVNDTTTGNFTVFARWKEHQYSKGPLTQQGAYDLRNDVMMGGLFDEQLESIEA
jgi:hypothetical protein